MPGEIQKRMDHREPHFRIENGTFFIEDMDYRTLVERYGTPLLCFSRNRLLDNVRQLSDVFAHRLPQARLFYAYKANYFMPILSDLQEYCGAEVISSLELALAQCARVQPSRIVFNGVGKAERDLRSCIEHDILFNVDSLAEILQANDLAAQYGKVIGIGLRIHPELGSYEDDAFIKGGSKLGLDLQSEAPDAVHVIMRLKQLRLKGLHAHVCSRQAQPDVHLTALESMVHFAQWVNETYGTKLEFLDIGGGYETRAVLERTGTIGQFAEQFSSRLNHLGSDISLYLEPGRYLVNDAGVVITNIVRDKINAGRKWLITDIATNFLIPVKNANFEMVPAALTGRPLERQSFGGGICSSADVIEQDVFLPSFREGDCAVVLNCGAYTSVMSEQFVYPRPAVVYVDGSDVRTLWERETVEDVIRLFSGHDT